VEGIVQASGIQDYNSMQDTTYEVTDTGLIVHKGIAGTRPDVDALKQQIQTHGKCKRNRDIRIFFCTLILGFRIVRIH